MHNIHPHNATEYSTLHNDHSHNALWQQCTISKLTMNCGNCTLTIHCTQCGNRLHDVNSHRAHYANRCTPLHCYIPNSLEVLQCTICALLLLHNIHQKQCAPTKHCSHCNMYIVHTPFKSATGCITGMHPPELWPRPTIHWECPLSVGEAYYTQKSHSCSCTNRWCKPKSLPCRLLIYLWEILWTFM